VRPARPSPFAFVVLTLVCAVPLGAQPSERLPPALLARLNRGETVRVIVQLRDPADREAPGGSGQAAADRDELQQRFVDRARARNVKRLRALPILAADVDAESLAELTASPDIVSVREDQLRRPELGTSVPLVGAPQAWNLAATGTGWAIAVLDTGVQKSHPLLSGKVVSEACYSTTSSISASVCPGSVDTTASGSGKPCSFAGCEHGTHVAGIAAGRTATIKGVAQGASLIAIQVFSRITSRQYCYPAAAPCPGAFDSDVLAGLDRVYALRHQFDVAAVNMSLGGGLYSSSCDSAIPAYKSAIDLLRTAGIASVISSGNAGAANAISAPACVSSAVSVGATTKSDQMAAYSNRSPQLKLVAPGSSIRSSVPGDGYATFDGTSMAAPHVAGAWAVIKHRQPLASVSSVLSTLTSTGLSVYDAGSRTYRKRIRVGMATQQTAPGAPVITSFSAQPGLPQPAHVPITWTTKAFTGTAAPQYKYWLFNPYQGGWVVLREYSSERSIVWTADRPGSYAVQVWVRATGSTAAYDLWQSSGTFAIEPTPATLLSVTADRTSPLPPAPVTFTATPRGGAGPLEFEFVRVDPVTQSTVVMRPYGPSNAWTWTPEPYDSGTVIVRARVRTVGANVAFEATADSAVFKLLGPRSFVLNSQPGDYVGAGVYRLEGGPEWITSVFEPTWAGYSLELSFRLPDYTSWWHFNFSAPNRNLLAPGIYEQATRYPFEQPGAGLSVFGDGRGCNRLTGRYVIQEFELVNGGLRKFAADFEQLCEEINPPLYGSVRYNSTVPPSDRPVEIRSFTTASTLPGKTTQAMTWVATTVGGGTPLQYRFWVFTPGSGWAVIQDGPSNAVTWTPQIAGSHALQVWVRSFNSKANYEAWSGSGFFDVEGPPIVPVSITSFTANTPFPVPVNTLIGWTTVATGGSGTLEYQYWRYDGNTGLWSILQPYGPSAEMSWQPAQPGTYAIQVWVRSVGSTASWQDWRSTGYFSVTAPP
jgi:hypothetical protein